MFVARIHNNTLGSVIEIETYERGIEIIKRWCDEQDFILTESDIKDIEDTYEYYNDDDSDNIFTFVIGDITQDGENDDSTD